jgi:hypothetical protein
MIARWKGIIEEIHFGGSIIPSSIIENLYLENTSFRPSKWPRKLIPAKNSKLPKLPKNCFEPVERGGWPLISTWIKKGIMKSSSGATNRTQTPTPSKYEAPSKYIFQTPTLFTFLFIFSIFSFSVQFSSIHSSKSSSIDNIQFPKSLSTTHTR